MPPIAGQTACEARLPSARPKSHSRSGTISTPSDRAILTGWPSPPRNAAGIPVEAVGHNREEPRAKYPRLVATVGEAPAQYPDPDDESRVTCLHSTSGAMREVTPPSPFAPAEWARVKEVDSFNSFFDEL